MSSYDWVDWVVWVIMLVEGLALFAALGALWKMHRNYNALKRELWRAQALFAQRDFNGGYKRRERL